MQHFQISCWLGVLLFAWCSPGFSEPNSHVKANSLDPLVDLLTEIPDPAVQLDILKGLEQAVKGQRKLPLPVNWPKASELLGKSPDPEIRKLTLSLSLIFGDPRAMLTLRKVVLQESAALKERTAAIDGLAQIKDPKLLPILHQLITHPKLRDAAIQRLAGYDSPDTPRLILTHYATFTTAEKQSALHTLVSRPRFAEELLTAVEKKQISRKELSTFLVRQIASFENPKLNARLKAVWGEYRPTSEEKVQEIWALKAKLAQPLLMKADRSEGRRLFAKTCAGCHVLFDAGRHIGPNLTGSQRANLDYLLANVVDPSAVVGRDYWLTTIALTDGRVLNGVVSEDVLESLTLKTPKEDVVIAKNEIEVRKPSRLSMMPEGLFKNLSEEELRNLVSYIISPAQVPLPITRQDLLPRKISQPTPAAAKVPPESLPQLADDTTSLNRKFVGAFFLVVLLAGCSTLALRKGLR